MRPRHVTLALLLVLATPVFAEDTPSARIPTYDIGDLLIHEPALPNGWSRMTDASPKGAPNAKDLLALATAAEIDEVDFDLRVMRTRKDEETGVVCFLAVEVPPDRFRELLDKKAGRTWTVTELGSPTRLGVVWASTASAAKTLNAWLREVSVRGLCTFIWVQYLDADGPADWDRAFRYLPLAGKIEPDAGCLNLLRGYRAVLLEKKDEAVAHWRKAFKAGVPAPMRPSRFSVIAAHYVGQDRLAAGGDKAVAEARVALEQGVAWEMSNHQIMLRSANRYNLACTYARLGMIDEAFEQLEAVRKIRADALKSGSSEAKPAEYERHYAHVATGDPDLAPLRKDPRFAALLKAYPGKPAKTSGSEPNDK